jgi:hypothetical protein
MKSPIHTDYTSSQAIEALNKTMYNPENINAIKEFVQKGGEFVQFVHKNKEEAIYQLSNERIAILFYSPIPVKPVFTNDKGEIIVCNEDSFAILKENKFEADYFRKHMALENFGQKLRRFFNANPREYYYVYPEKALNLLGLVKEEKNPKEICNYLGLENKVLSGKEIKEKINSQKSLMKFQQSLF